MNRALAAAKQHVRFFNEPDAIQRCLAGRLYKGCAESMLKTARAVDAVKGGKADKIALHEGVVWMATAFATRYCSGVDLTTQQADILSATMDAWQIVIRNP